MPPCKAAAKPAAKAANGEPGGLALAPVEDAAMNLQLLQKLQGDITKINEHPLFVNIHEADALDIDKKNTQATKPHTIQMLARWP